MAGQEDIQIQISMELAKALSDLKNLEQQINTTKKSIDGNLSPSVDNTSTRLTGLGNKVTDTGNKIKQKLGTEAALAFAAAGTAALSFAKNCIDSAIKSESAWTRFGSLVDSNGGNWDAQKTEIKGWAKEFSNSVGRTVGDTREAMSNFMQIGMSVDQTKTAMNAAAGVAARTGQTEAEASTMITQALLGKGKQLEKLTGLRIDDFKTADGQVDKEKLLNALYEQNKGAIEDYANTTEGQINKMNNSWGSFKTQIGQALLPVVKVIADVATTIANGFANLPGPVKTFIAVLLLVGGAVGAAIGVLGLLAPALVSIGGIITAIGEAGSIMAVLSPVVTGLGAGFTTILGAIAPLVLPILAVVAAFTALYLIGIQMGWWSDLNGMISKFGEVLGQVAGALMNFISWFGKLFTDFPAAQKEFNDFVNSLDEIIINGLSQLGGIIWQTLQSAFSNINLNDLLMVFFPLPMLIYQALSGIAPFVFQAFTQIQSTARMAVGGVVNAIIQRFMGIIFGVGNVFMFVLNTIRARLTQARAVAGLLATAIRTAIVTRIQAVVARIRTFFSNIVSTIRSRMSNAVSAARQKALEIYNNIKNKIQSIPQTVADEFGKIPGKIQSALSNAASAALSGAANIVSSFLSGLQRHSPGKVQRETVAEFNSIPGIITDSGVKSAKQAGLSAKGIVNSWESNMDVLGVPFEETNIPQFNSYNFGNLLNDKMNSIIPQFNLLNNSNITDNLDIMKTKMNDIKPDESTVTSRNISNISNDDHTIIYNIQNLHLDLNKMQHDEKQVWWNMLNSIQGGA